MKLSQEDQRMLAGLCDQYKISFNKVLKLLDTIKEFEFKDRRTGIYDALKDIIKSDLAIGRA